MDRTYIIDIKNKEEVKVKGFIVNIRNKSTMAFLVLKDISGKVQITLEKVAFPELSDVVEQITLDTVVTIEGKVVENPHVKLNGIEILPRKITIESVADALPIQREENKSNSKDRERSSIDQRIDYRWIDLRTEKNQLIFKLQTHMVDSMRKFFINKNFMEIHSPKLIGAASESGSDVFELNYFERKAYLSQSPQFYKQMAMASGFERIFEVGPVFRAEKSYTSKHATEFTGFDVEISFIETFIDVMKLEEELLVEVITKINDKFSYDIKRLYDIDIIIPTTPFPQIKLKDLYEELEKEYGYIVEEEYKSDLTTDAEKLSYQWVKDKFNHEFLFVTDFDAKKRAFYHMREDGIPQGYDLIWRGVEITTGAQREHRYDILKKQANEKGLGEDVKFYLEFFRYGCPPHGGFGIGVDRLTMLFLGLVVKEAMFVFRGPNRLEP